MKRGDIKHCANCGQPFAAYNPQHIYCRWDCRPHNRARKIKPNLIERQELPQNSFIPALPGIYSIMCVDTSRMYVGKSGNMNNRIQTHLSQLRAGRHKTPELQEDYNKYGEESILITPLEVGRGGSREEARWSVFFGEFAVNDEARAYQNPKVIRVQSLQDVAYRALDLLEDRVLRGEGTDEENHLIEDARQVIANEDDLDNDEVI